MKRMVDTLKLSAVFDILCTIACTQKEMYPFSYSVLDGAAGDDTTVAPPPDDDGDLTQDPASLTGTGDFYVRHPQHFIGCLVITVHKKV